MCSTSISTTFQAQITRWLMFIASPHCTTEEAKNPTMLASWISVMPTTVWRPWWCIYLMWLIGNSKRLTNNLYVYIYIPRSTTISTDVILKMELFRPRLYSFMRSSRWSVVRTTMSRPEGMRQVLWLLTCLWKNPAKEPWSPRKPSSRPTNHRPQLMGLNSMFADQNPIAQPVETDKEP